MKFDFISDAGHGWLQVTFDDLKMYAHKIIKDISEYSYISSHGFVYLEEDCDAGLFLKELEDQNIFVEYTWIDVLKGESDIRKLPRYNWKLIPN